LPGISTIYHYQYEFTEADVFVGMRVFFREGIGCGKWYTAQDCDSMLLQDEGLNEATVGELKMATSTLHESDLSRERAAGQGARLLRGEEHKGLDAGVRLQKEVKKNDVKAQKEQAAKDAAARVLAASRVMLCKICGSCSRPGEFGCKFEHWTGECVQGARGQGAVLPQDYEAPKGFSAGTVQQQRGSKY
jgi:hypothetical protein